MMRYRYYSQAGTEILPCPHNVVMGWCHLCGEVNKQFSGTMSAVPYEESTETTIKELREALKELLNAYMEDGGPTADGDGAVNKARSILERTK